MQGFFFNPPVTSIYIGHQLAEIYKEQVYAPFFAGKKDLTVLDVGGNIGMASYYFSQFAKVVHTFEPSAEHFEILQFMVNFNKLDNVVLHNVAISNQTGEATMYHMKNKTMYSLKPAMATDDKETVRTVRLNEFLEKNKIDHVDFMKLDVEGFEPDILCGDAFQSVAKKIDMVFIETHAWMDRDPNQIWDALKTAGFSIESVPNEASLIIAKRI